MFSFWSVWAREINEWVVCVLASSVFFTVSLPFHCYYYHCPRQHAIACVASRTTVGWYFIRLPSSIPSFWVSGSVDPWEWDLVLFLLKIGFFFTGVLVFWFFGFKIYTWYFYLVLCVVIFLVFILAFFSAIAAAVLYFVHAL